MTPKSPTRSTEKKIGRRELLGGLTVGAVGLACGGGQSGGAAPAVHAQKNVRWRLASSFPRSLDTIFGAAEHLAERVAAMTGGAFEIRVYAAGELVPALNVLDAVQAGTAHCGQTGSYYYIGKHPALAFDTCLPFGLTARQQTAWLTEGGGAAKLAPIFASFGIRSFLAGNTGAQMGGWFKRPVENLSALQGLKMRIPGLGGQVMSKLGVSVQNIAGGDIFPALDRGAIDATEWVGPYDDEKLGFHKAAKIYHYPGWWEPGPSLSFYVGEAAWNELSAEYRAIFEVAARETALWMQQAYDARNPPALERLLAEGVQLVPFPREVLTAARAAAEAIYDEEASKSAEYKAILDDWRAFRNRAVSWSAITEIAYATAANLAAENP
jgi:TRAP-type mannitol/chloroaromatic compound transport system substrate-binding protein